MFFINRIQNTLACQQSSSTIEAGWLLSLLIIALIPAAEFLQSTPELREYCQSESFRATCWSGKVIVMETAKYGRMEIGRCVNANLGYISCSRDVMNIADRRCSGRRECTIAVPNEELDATKPCYAELKTYLLASYDCVTVATAQKSLCDSSNFVKLVSTEGYLSSIVTTETGCGSTNTPWIIHVDKGQRVNMTLLDFSVPSDVNGRGVKQCTKYVSVLERSINRTSYICGGGTRESHAYLSKTNTVEVAILNQSEHQDKKYFLLKYETVGCRDLVPPTGGWFRRSKLGGIVGCKESDRTWHLACEDNKWVGLYENCTEQLPPTKDKSKATEQILQLPYGLSVAIIIGIALAIGLLILAFGLICFAKNRFPRRTVKKQNPGGSVSYKVYEKAPSTAVDLQGGAAYVLHHHNPVSINGNEYSHIWESQMPDTMQDGPFHEPLYAGRCECTYQQRGDICLTRLNDDAPLQEKENSTEPHCSNVATCKPVPIPIAPKAPCHLADDPQQLCDNSRRFVTFEPRDTDIIGLNSTYNPDVVPPGTKPS